MTALVNVRYGTAISAPTDAGRRLDTRQRPRIGDDAADRRCGGGQGRGEERPATLALAALEIAVRRADRVLAGRQLIAVHRDAHRAARLAPFPPGGPENLPEALALGLPLPL